MSRTKKVIIAIIVIIAIAGISFGAVWLGTNWDKITSQTDLYTYQDMIDYSEEKNQELQDELENYKLLYEEAIKKMSEAEDDKNKLTIQLAQVQSELDKALEKQELDEETILELQTDLNKVQELLTQAEKDLLQLQKDYNDVLEDNSDLSDDIEELRTENVSLQNQITDLQAQLKAYEDMNLTDYYKLEFIDTSTDLVVSSLYLKEGSNFEVPTIEQTKDTWFYGWSTTENSDVVFDFSNFEVDNDYTFYSVLGETVPVRLNDNEKCYFYGKNLTVKDILVFDNRIDFSDENLELVLDSGITLDTPITELSTQGYQIDLSGTTVYEYVLNAEILLNIQAIDTNYSISAGDSHMSVRTLDELSKYNVDFLSLKNINLTLISNEEGFTDNVEIKNLNSKNKTLFSNRIEYSTTGTFAGYNFTITFGNFFTRNGYGINVNFETLPNGINSISVENCSFIYELENSYISLLSDAIGSELPYEQN